LIIIYPDQQGNYLLDNTNYFFKESVAAFAVESTALTVESAVALIESVAALAEESTALIVESAVASEGEVLLPQEAANAPRAKTNNNFFIFVILFRLRD